MRETRKVGYVRVDARRSFWGALIVFTLVGVAFVMGVVVGQQVESPLRATYETPVVTTEGLEASEVYAPPSRADLTFYDQIPDARAVAVPQQPPRRTVTFSHDPVEPQPGRPEGELPEMPTDSREISASALESGL